MSSETEFSELVDRFHAPLYRFALSLTCSEADACDLVQQTFYIWLRKQDRIRDKARVKAWLFTTLHREFLQARRRGNRFQHVDIDGVPDELPAQIGINWAELDARQIISGLEQIDEIFRAPLALFYLEDLSYDEISRALELPIGTVKSRLSRGVANLRAVFTRDIRSQKGGGHG